ncbi:hypothetical protein NLJ89_g2515 [Agrocybe chaxingu]|uniref:Uncharacterized protein n=1 Tax=Agrocybe chaxingu TaxID=84603 RepID=A0A9W8MYP4_9AGAR|nr:hypothetical protein NLJ89_g2515 [Agrocybe chaxingu]
MFTTFADRSVGAERSSSQSMMDELLTPSPTKRRTQLKKSSAARDSSTSAAISTKPKPTLFKARPTQENSVAGPSTPRKPAAAPQAPTRLSARVSRPTFKKAAVQRRHHTGSDSDSDSDKTPPPSILPRYYAAKKRKLADAKAPTHRGMYSPFYHYSLSHVSSGKETSTKRSGAIELSSSSEEDARSQPPRKRAKSKHDFSKATGVIDLCSEEEPIPSPTKTKTAFDSDVIVILSSSDEAEPTKPTSQPRSSPVLPAADQLSPPASTAQQPTVCATALPPSASPVVSPEPNRPVSIQDLYHATDEIESVPEEFEFATAFISSFAPAAAERPPRQIKYTDQLPTPALHTSIFFSKAAKSLELSARRKLSKKMITSRPSCNTPSTSHLPEEVHRVSSSTLPDHDYDRDARKDSREETSATISDGMDIGQIPVSLGPVTVPEELPEAQVQSQPERHDTLRVEVANTLELEQTEGVFQAEETIEMPKRQDPVPISSERVQLESSARVDPDARQQNKEASQGRATEPDSLTQKAALSSRKLVDLLLSKRASKAFVPPSQFVARRIGPVATGSPSNPVVSSSVVSEIGVTGAGQVPDIRVNKPDSPVSLEPDATAAASLVVDLVESKDVLAVDSFEPSSVALTTGVDATFELGMPTASGEAVFSGNSSLPVQEAPQVAEDQMSVDVAAPPLDNFTAKLIDKPQQAETPQHLFPDTHLDTQEPRDIPSTPRGSTVGSATTEESPAPDTPPQKTTTSNHIRAFDISILDLSEMSLPLLLESSKPDDDDDAISLSGLELSYPEEVF